MAEEQPPFVPSNRLTDVIQDINRLIARLYRISSDEAVIIQNELDALTDRAMAERGNAYAELSTSGFLQHPVSSLD